MTAGTWLTWSRFGELPHAVDAAQFAIGLAIDGRQPRADRRSGIECDTEALYQMCRGAVRIESCDALNRPVASRDRAFERDQIVRAAANKRGVGMFQLADCFAPFHCGLTMWSSAFHKARSSGCSESRSACSAATPAGRAAHRPAAVWSGALPAWW